MNNIPQIDFNSIKNLAIGYANSMKYDLNDFNCTDFALNILNFIRPSNNKIIVPDWIGNTIDHHNYGTTPNGLYIALKQMKDNNSSEAGNIEIGTFHAPISYGPCD